VITKTCVEGFKTCFSSFNFLQIRFRKTLFPKNLAEFSSQFQENENTHFVNYKKGRKKERKKEKIKQNEVFAIEEVFFRHFYWFDSDDRRMPRRGH
jgi:hypothetical protein